MAASQKTVDRVLAVIHDHVPDDVAERMLAALVDVPGNESFRKTCKMLLDGLRRKRT